MSIETRDNRPPETANSMLADDRVATILRDIGCPACGYNLRGLHGPIVECPECGQRCDVPRMVAARWTGPWWKAPGFNTVLMPTVWLLVSFISMTIVSLVLDSAAAIVAIPLVFLGLLAFLGFLLWRAWQLFASMRGVWLALLGHVIFAGYGVGVIGAVGFILVIILTLIDVWDRTSLTWEQAWVVGLNLLFALLCGVVTWLCRRGERFIAGQCIKRYLAKRRGEVAVDG